ncbi:AraC family transcriptional regulator [Chitinophagaceae bacterium 26-R-25]|nr:AraC family transcriptional regulator [Chitinophagaceae bacterium 26-R-25]
MKEILTDWGVDRLHFNKLYKTVRKVFGDGVVLNNDRINIDNQVAKGSVDFFPFDNSIAMLRINVLFTETINFKRLCETRSKYYACLFSLKEGVDLHVFDGGDESEMNHLGLSANHSVLYFSSDVQTLFRVVPNEQAKIVILVFASDTLDRILRYAKNIKFSNFRDGQSVKGYTSMPVEMVERLTHVFEFASPDHILPLYLLGAVYQLLAILFLQIEADRQLLVQSTGVAEVARMVQIRNLLVADFSVDCPLLEDMARKAQMSVTKFKTLFKKLFKLSYYQYYQRYRLLAARQAIALGKSVTETAYDFSFNSISNFSVAFKKMFKVSPSEIEAQAHANAIAFG